VSTASLLRRKLASIFKSLDASRNRLFRMFRYLHLMEINPVVHGSKSSRRLTSGMLLMLVLSGMVIEAYPSESTYFTYEPLAFGVQNGNSFTTTSTIWPNDKATPEEVCHEYADHAGWNRNNFSVSVLPHSVIGAWRCQRYYKGQKDDSNYRVIISQCSINSLAPLIATFPPGYNWTYPYFNISTGKCFCNSIGYYFDPATQVCSTTVKKCEPPFTLNLSNNLCETHCSTGATWDPIAERCIPPSQEQNCKTQGRSPIDFIEGRKYRSESVLSSGARYPFSLTYFFNNQRNQEKTPIGSKVAVVSGDRYLAATKPPMTASDYQALYTNRGTPTGGSLYLASQHYGGIDQYWRHNFDEILQIHGNQYLYQTAKGHEVIFAGFGAAATYPYLRLQALVSGEESFTGYKLTNSKTSEIKKFNSNGRLIKIERSPQDILILTYDSQNRLEQVTNSEGAYIQLAYQNLVTDSIYSTISTSHAYLISATNNRGESSQINWGKTYQGKTAKFHLITQITEAAAGPAQSARIFEYNDARWPASVTDQYFVADIANGENRKKLLHFEYDDLGRAIFSGLNGRRSDSVAYVDADTRVVTNALGKQATYKFADFDGVRRLQSVTGEPTQNCVSSEVSYAYDANGNVIRKTQNGKITEYQYDSQNREISRTEAVGTSDARTITTEYHPSLNFPVRIAEPSLVTEMIYNVEGRLLKKRVQHKDAQ
jgi:YD repeat-containing protein